MVQQRVHMWWMSFLEHDCCQRLTTEGMGDTVVGCPHTAGADHLETGEPCTELVARMSFTVNTDKTTTRVGLDL